MDFQPPYAVFTNSRHEERLRRICGRGNVVDADHPTAFDMTRFQALLAPRQRSAGIWVGAEHCAGVSLGEITIDQEVRALKIAGTVAARIVMSRPSDQFSTYSVPSSARFEKGRSLRPRTCQRPVMPGRVAS